MIHLDESSLEQLRSVITWATRARDRALLEKGMLELAASLNLPGRLVVDLEASERLGHPLVIFQAPRANRLTGLTRREMEVARYVAAGLANKQIAIRLGISVSTVKDHVHRILAKTGLASRAAIAASADPIL